MSSQPWRILALFTLRSTRFQGWHCGILGNYHWPSAETYARLCITMGVSIVMGIHMGMDQYLLIPFLGGWTSIYQLFWCSPGVQGFDTLPHEWTMRTSFFCCSSLTLGWSLTFRKFWVSGLNSFLTRCDNKNTPVSNHLPSGKHTKNHGKSPFSSWVNPLFQWPFSIAFCMLTRRYIKDHLEGVLKWGPGRSLAWSRKRYITESIRNNIYIYIYIYIYMTYTHWKIKCFPLQKSWKSWWTIVNKSRFRS